MQYGEAPPTAVGLRSFPLLTDASALEKSVTPVSTKVIEAPGGLANDRRTERQHECRKVPSEEVSIGRATHQHESN